jgi:SLT domain-containing protein
MGYNKRMNDNRINPLTITGRINANALDLLDKNPEGLRWVDLATMIKKSDASFHPKTVNGCIWLLVEKFPDLVYKPSKGLFRLLKYKSMNEKI